MRYELIVGYNAHRPIYTDAEQAQIEAEQAIAEQKYNGPSDNMLTVLNVAHYVVAMTFIGYDESKSRYQETLDKSFKGAPVLKDVKPEEVVAEAPVTIGNRMARIINGEVVWGTWVRDK